MPPRSKVIVKIERICPNCREPLVRKEAKIRGFHLRCKKPKRKEAKPPPEVKTTPAVYQDRIDFFKRPQLPTCSVCDQSAAVWGVELSTGRMYIKCDGGHDIRKQISNASSSQDAPQFRVISDLCSCMGCGVVYNRTFGCPVCPNGVYHDLALLEQDN